MCKDEQVLCDNFSFSVVDTEKHDEVLYAILWGNTHMQIFMIHASFIKLIHVPVLNTETFQEKTCNLIDICLMK